MTSTIKKGLAALFLVAIITVGSYAFASRAADSNGMSGSTQTTPNTNPSMVPSSGMVTNPATGQQVPSTGSGTSATPQTNVIVPQTVMPSYVPAGESLGDLIVLNGLFGDNGLAAGTTVVTDKHGKRDKVVTSTSSNQDLAGLLAVNNLLSPYGGVGGYGGYMASPYAGYAAAPYGGMVGAPAGDTLGGLIVLNGLFGDNTTTVTSNGRTIVSDSGLINNSGLSSSAESLAGLIAVNNLTSPYGGGIGGYGGYMAAPYAGYTAAPYAGYAAGGMVGAPAGDTLGGLIVLNGLFGANDTLITDDCDDTFVRDRAVMSDSARELAGLIAVQNTTSPFGI